MDAHSGHRARKKQQFSQHGLDAFGDHEVLELLLFYAIPQRDTKPIARALLGHFGSLEAVFTAPLEELRKVKGVGENAACLIHLILPLYRRVRTDSRCHEQILNSARNAGDFVVNLFAGVRDEVAYLLCLDVKCKLLLCTKLNDGVTNAVTLNVRRILEIALLHHASGIILAHNHPSGLALPSHEDYTATRQIQDALQAVNIALVDHIIVADDDFVSMADSGFLH